MPLKSNDSLLELKEIPLIGDSEAFLQGNLARFKRLKFRRTSYLEKVNFYLTQNQPMKLLVFLEEATTKKIHKALLSDPIYVESRVNDKDRHEVRIWVIIRKKLKVQPTKYSIFQEWVKSFIKRGLQTFLAKNWKSSTPMRDSCITSPPKIWGRKCSILCSSSSNFQKR